MYRCTKNVPRLTQMLAASLLAVAPLLAGAQAALPRPFPQNALRGVIEFGTPPWVRVNNQPAQLAPGARIRGADNMIVMSGALVGKTYAVNYTVESGGLVRDVWLLRPDEIAKVWPGTPAETTRWSFDPAAQTWIRR